MTVRTLESLLRLATAHAKLSLSKEVDIKDIDMAMKLLNMTIFREELQDEVDPKADAEMEEEQADEKDEVVPLAQKSNRALRRDKRGKKPEGAAGQDEEVIDTTQSKRAKIDHNEEVSQLFGAKITHADDA